MEPSTDREKEIANRVDSKAKAIAEGQGYWGDNIIVEMRVAVPFVMSNTELEFLERYIAYKRHTP
jgi:hypothetical protein